MEKRLWRSTLFLAVAFMFTIYGTYKFESSQESHFWRKFPKYASEKDASSMHQLGETKNSKRGRRIKYNSKGELDIRSSGADVSFYDIAVVSITPFWSWKSKLPREIQCSSDTMQNNASVLLRRATENAENIKRADILIFSDTIVSETKWRELQMLRHSRQVWVHTTEESPYTSQFAVPKESMGIRFNLSFTYHPNADISVPYGEFIQFQKQDLYAFKSNYEKKTELISWVASNCVNVTWRRQTFVQDLAKYIVVDMYGECGNLRCPKWRFGECVKIFKNYKFYLATENSCCGGYITEKFWQALSIYNAIPVVVGASRKGYENVAPNNSFIHADDFGSLRELAGYILKVSQDKEMYDSYFHWKRLGIAKRNKIPAILAHTNEGVCKLIGYLRAHDNGPLSTHPFDAYGPNWFGGCNSCGNHDWLKNYSYVWRWFHKISVDVR